jgi:MraZ protein
MIFTGYAEHAIDEKNRLALPSKFRNRLDPKRDGNGFFITIGTPRSTLWIYTERQFEWISEGPGSGLIPDKAPLKFDQLFFPLAEWVDIDAQGRMTIPVHLLKRSALPREVVICGVRDHMEVRPREGFEREMESNPDYEEAREAYRLRPRPPENGNGPEH